MKSELFNFIIDHTNIVKGLPNSQIRSENDVVQIVKKEIQ